jgi:hypothetical protein
MRVLGNRQIQSVLWIVFYLTLLDIATNIIFRFPTDPQNSPPSFLQGYFEYGRSVEGKFECMIKAAKVQSESTLRYGWIQNKSYESLPKKAVKSQTLVAVYGMSHAELLGKAIAKVDSEYIVRNIMAPGAPPAWSFAAYEADKDQHEAKVVILGIMTDNIAYLSATSGATSYFDMSHPYTFPRYFVENGQLKKVWPPFFTEEGFREYLNDSRKWTEYTDWLAKNDKFYDAFLFKRSLTDKSALFRLLRRAYAQKLKERLFSHVYTKDGFNLNSDENIALQGIVIAFARSARKQERLPIVYIVNNEGRKDHLYKALKPVLDANRIPFLSTHIICPPDDPSAFTGINSHFTPSKDMELAREMIKVIKANLE